MAIGVDDVSRIGLDWPILLDRLCAHAQTIRGRAAVPEAPFSDSLEEALRRYGAVSEVIDLEQRGGAVPLSGIADIAPLTQRAARGEVLEAEALVDIGGVLVGLVGLRRWAAGRAVEAPQLAALAEPIELPDTLGQLLDESFDGEGAVSSVRYPEVGRLRRRLAQLRARIRTTLESMVSDPAISAILQERFITERGGRFVLPIRAGARKGLGIVHDTSRSGETAYVEPTAVVEPQNELMTTQAALRREEWRVMAALSREVGAVCPDIERALAAATALDLASARARLGLELDGHVPTVRAEGVVHLLAARHPVLVLREIDVVANDLRLDSRTLGLVLSGSNAGGKTVALKTIGLFALMVRAGVPIPAAPDSRMDWFAVVRASVGDLQAVSSDLSTFSAQMVQVREALEAAGESTLILLDEIGVGTDPAQGAALAQAVVEALVEAGTRVVTTTHFADLKDLAARDPRMQLSGAVFADGAPTYRIEADLMGHSHALAVAREMAVPEAVVVRARTLLDSTSRRLDDLMQRLESERVEVSQAAIAQAEQHRTLSAQALALDKRAAKLDARRDRDEGKALAVFRERLKAQEMDLKRLIAALQTNPNLRDAGEVLAQVKASRLAVTPSTSVPETPVSAVGLGDRVQVLGGVGTVVSIQGERVDVEVRGKRLRVRLGDLGEARPQGRKKQPSVQVLPPVVLDDGPACVRTLSNTIDLRGMRVEETIDAIAAFLDDLILANQPSAFLLHGHGTGALKSAIRVWLRTSPYGRDWHAGGPTEGGDAFTVVEL